MKTKIFIGVVLFLVIGWASQYVSGLKEEVKSKDMAISGLSSDLSAAKTTIDHLNTESIRINKLNEANSRKIQALINQSTKTQEEIKNAIKDNKCVNVALPTAFIDIVRKRAISINNQATNTSESN